MVISKYIQNICVLWGWTDPSIEIQDLPGKYSALRVTPRDIQVPANCAKLTATFNRQSAEDTQKSTHPDSDIPRYTKCLPIVKHWQPSKTISLERPQGSIGKEPPTPQGTGQPAAVTLQYLWRENNSRFACHPWQSYSLFQGDTLNVPLTGEIPRLPYPCDWQLLHYPDKSLKQTDNLPVQPVPSTLTPKIRTN